MPEPLLVGICQSKSKIEIELRNAASYDEYLFRTTLDSFLEATYEVLTDLRSSGIKSVEVDRFLSRIKRLTNAG